MTGWLWLESIIIGATVTAAVALVVIIRGNRQIDRAFRECRVERVNPTNVRKIAPKRKRDLGRQV